MNKSEIRVINNLQDQNYTISKLSKILVGESLYNIYLFESSFIKTLKRVTREELSKKSNVKEMFTTLPECNVKPDYLEESFKEPLVKKSRRKVRQRETARIIS